MSSQKNLGTSIDHNEYSEFSTFLSDACGIDLGANKQYLVSTRVRRILLDNSLASLTELTRRIDKGGDRELRQQVIDAMTTNETFWFRDGYPFDYLEKTLLPSYATKTPRRIRIWSAACSSGQEPYSISMIIEESLKRTFGADKCIADIIATDLSSKILETAKIGQYDKLAIIRGLSEERSKSHFTKIGTETWQVNDSIKARVGFRPLNLQESYVLLGKFDIVFCRNVLIYFSSELKQEILKKIHAAMVPGGILFLGSSESVSGLTDYYDMVHCNPGIAYKVKPSKH